MKLAILLVFLFSVAAVSAQQKVTEAEMKIGREIMETITTWADAVRDRDAKRLDAILAEDAVITTLDGKVRGKAEEMEAMKPDQNLRASAVTNEDVGVKVFGEVGVVTALTRMKFVSNGAESNIAMRYTAVFVKRDGRWQIVALQTARAPQTSN
ncbi:MAG TPA: nuclear transport factor 2 family protein [Pyrinomonadaceae bacterium]|nr:nuclear transport factor 2 family protein [Pyrinomonadaceae bacterium]